MKDATELHYGNYRLKSFWEMADIRTKSQDILASAASTLTILCLIPPLSVL